MNTYVIEAPDEDERDMCEQKATWKNYGLQFLKFDEKNISTNYTLTPTAAALDPRHILPQGHAFPSLLSVSDQRGHGTAAGSVCTQRGSTLIGKHFSRAMQ